MERFVLVGGTLPGKDRKMTVSELYDWAVMNDAEDLDIEIQYRDGGGFYNGTDDHIEPQITFSNGQEIVLL
jgi:hypothetical protein